MDCMLVLSVLGEKKKDVLKIPWILDILKVLNLLIVFIYFENLK